MKHEEIIRQLKAPFSFEEVEAKIQFTNGDKTKGKAVFYLDARAVHERLDTILGAFNWRNEYIKWNEKSQICGLSIYNSEDGEWITKAYDKCHTFGESNRKSGNGFRCFSQYKPTITNSG